MATKTQEGTFTTTLSGGGPLYFKVNTTYQTDSSGNPVPGSATHTLLYNPGNGTYYPAATTTDFKTFNLLKYEDPSQVEVEVGSSVQPDGTVLGAGAAQSLQTYDGQINKAMRNAVTTASINNGLSTSQAQLLQAPTAPVLPRPARAGGGDDGDDEDGGAGGGDAGATVTIENLNLLAGKPLPGRPPKTNYGNDMRYPELMREMDAIQFTAKLYGGRGFANDQIGFAETRTLGETTGVATLGIQPSISDSNTVNWSGLEMSLLETAFSQGGLSFIGSGGAGLESIIQNTINTFNMEEGAKQALLTLIAQEGATTKGLLSRLTGGVSNPNLELLFQGPQLRTFNFNFSLSPRRKEESVMVKRIINFFKRNMSVQRSNANLFLKAPNVFEIKYLYAGNTASEHKGLNKIKTCALLNCSVDYTPTGSYMTFNESDEKLKTNSMVTYNLSLAFQELEPVYEDEYESGENVTEIGY